MNEQLGKRALVDYSEDEDSDPATAAREIQTDSKPVLRQPHNLGDAQQPKRRKLISYDKLGAGNAMKSLLAGTSKAQESMEEASLNAETRRKRIAFDTVTGAREFTLDEPREKMWRGKKEQREPYYYKAMKEIYHDRLGALNEPEHAEGVAAEATELVSSVATIGGREETVRDISQKELVQFDYGKYMEQKERKELLLEGKLKHLQGQMVGDNHAKTMVRAMELLDKEAALQASGKQREDGFKRNKRQYGF